MKIIVIKGKQRRTFKHVESARKFVGKSRTAIILVRGINR